MAALRREWRAEGPAPGTPASRGGGDKVRKESNRAEERQAALISFYGSVRANRLEAYKAVL